MKETTVKEHCELYIPRPDFILIEKDTADEKHGSLYLTQTTRQRMGKWAGTGRIRSISPFRSETAHDAYLQALYEVNDHVKFNMSTPIDMPLPPNTHFKKEEKEIGLILIHASDLLGWLAKDLAEAKSIIGRESEALAALRTWYIDGKAL